MGTRSITVVTSSWDGSEKEPCATIYRHWDGYLEGHGQWLSDFLSDVTVTNGAVDKPKHYNGPGRLACGIVSALEADEHNPDLVPHGSVMGQEFEYHVHCDYGMDGGTLTVTVFDGPMTAFGMGGEDCNNQIFSGTPSEFAEFLTKETEAEQV